MLESETGELGFYQILKEMNGNLLEVETHEVGIYQDSVRHRHYYRFAI